jgi:hypothetical protein
MKIKFQLALLLLIFANNSNTFGQLNKIGQTPERQKLKDLNPIKFKTLNIKYPAYSSKRLTFDNNPIILYRYSFLGCSTCSDSSLSMLINSIKKANNKYRLIVAHNAPNSRISQIFETKMKNLNVKTIAIENIPIAFDSISNSYFSLIDNDGNSRYFIVPALSELSVLNKKIERMFILYNDQPVKK